MSHTYRYYTPDYSCIVVVNSDWSGPAKLYWRLDNGPSNEAELPGEILRAIFESEGKKFARAHVLKSLGLEDE